MNPIKVLIAENCYLFRKGFGSLVSQIDDFLLVGEVEKAEDLAKKIIQFDPDVLVIDYTSECFCLNDISSVRRNFPNLNILAITDVQSKIAISKAIEYGVMGHLLKSCGKEEIVESIYCTSSGQKYMCSKIIDLILLEKEAISKNTSCDGIKISDREIQILQLIAEGYANKQIADKLFISKHTVMTHRKHLMGKLKINNTASLVMYAVRENLLSVSSSN